MADRDDKIRVLFVCLGNICRSPTAEGVFRGRLSAAGLTGSVEVDSCGTAAYHVGEAPDPRTQRAAKERGYDLSGLRARQFKARDLDEFDYVLCADVSNLAEVKRKVGGKDRRARVGLFLSWAGGDEDEIPDPYYGGEAGFEHVLDLCEQASDALLDEIRGRLA